ncbi:type II toxin-antitoxin system RelE/ParE family toxin [Winogradskyella luteola]|uniref:Type II toxin-antitoxin system RelE/ParE family toxin n=1 Tax=Winogradskyella luteola TaxID=2828330 RepID=A0A9X1FBC2_9FLAO|nr:type II toxin-antitoxin system RelE/ParE family toxin [Winogradskyella luteola]
MDYNIQIPKTVIAEIDRSLEWYESKEEGLADKLQNELKSKINRIKENPKLFKEVGTNHRRAVLGSSFPFTVHYLINDRTKTVKIIGVFHQSQNLELVKEKIQIRKIHELKQEKDRRLIQRQNQLKQLRQKQELEKDIGQERDRGLER